MMELRFVQLFFAYLNTLIISSLSNDCQGSAKVLEVAVGIRAMLQKAPEVVEDVTIPKDD